MLYSLLFFNHTFKVKAQSVKFLLFEIQIGLYLKGLSMHV